MEVSLNHLRPGRNGQVISVSACEGIGDRLRKIGVRPGVTLHCCQRSLNGQETILQIGDMCVRLQTRDLEKIRVMI